MKNVKVIMNEQHSLSSEQEAKLRSIFGVYESGHNPDDCYEDVCVSKGYDIVSVPADGWTLSQMDEVIRDLKDVDTVVFVSPIPYLLAKLSREITYEGEFENVFKDVRLFHNDRREKKELPNGRVISVVAQEGWQLIKI